MIDYQISVEYIGDLRTKSIHQKSSSELITDAPLDNEGLGRKFSPTDLVASSLGSCLLTIMGIVAKRHKIDMNGSYAKIQKVMRENPRMIKEINIEQYLPENIKENQLKILKKAATHCPVHNSLSNEIDININYKS